MKPVQVKSSCNKEMSMDLLSQYGVDIESIMESIMENMLVTELSKSLDKQIISDIFKIGEIEKENQRKMIEEIDSKIDKLINGE